MNLPLMESVVTGRTGSRFSSLLGRHTSELKHAFHGRRVLVTGGAGTIGSAAVHVLLDYLPSCVHVVDHNENSLVELVRDIRGGRQLPAAIDLKLSPVDFGSPAMSRLIREEQPFDTVLHFAAVKHVRSEKDVYSILHMFDTNVLKVALLIDWLRARDPHFRLFSVSTDKAANPANLMGASKRLMEAVALEPNHEQTVTSARFANVAFSAGSLLSGVLSRIEHRQVVAVPSRTRRYFITAQEAAHICLLASACTPTRHLLIPKLNPATELVAVATAVEHVIRKIGFQPRIYENEVDARHSIDRDLAQGLYPMLLTAPDTDGEKSFEEFVGTDERTEDIGLEGLLAVQPAAPDPAALQELLTLLHRWIDNPHVPIDKPAIISAVSSTVPLHHLSYGRNLDQAL